MRIALAGLGDIAQKAYLPALTRHLNATPILCTRNPATLARLANHYRIDETYTDYSAMLKSRPDAVMIHSSTESHFDLATAALNECIPVFVDKPLSYNLNHSEQLVALAMEKNCPLFCGFNRRYAPLYQAPLAVKPVSVIYQKNRHNLAGAPREFIFDDFIHVVDFVRHASPDPVLDFQVHPFFMADALASISVSWRSAGASFTAAMNRVSGQTRERLEYNGLNASWQVDNLRQGQEMLGNQVTAFGFGDWDETLYKRGFFTMLEEFIAQVETRQANADYLQGVLASHRLCESILEQAVCDI
ncbi:Gfo/Idh/MocA family oxidoreductase [Gilvimarinus sp. SDUM040013]|uniref:Gfo/Idh/MocA family oxidoreductase n=1 Tax=Gilvimarinus gilvus TaxID=3058038 RepID=A0ABU4RYV3_9GAMM|nr:Gfo/Idh/MocA family oxidoreductase [Gilvimarinus sp. SDUM040013]MDO3384585.1 Gfo/Idh/MocA family oxidoreductase [Gilvimarinus sp. SDUM040013]MDX6850079.1 Gfo/Idh/MocA family oxidoreductase [Gilvimarinus sp. SDUM040013]